MLYLWMPEGDAAWRWRVEGEWHVAANWDALLQATATENQREVVVFFPTSSVQMLRQPMTRPQLRQIGANGVRYLLEEFSLVPVDQLTVRYQLDHDQHVNVLALSTGSIQHYQQLLALGAWRIQALLPDYLILPAPVAGSAVHATLLVNQRQSILRVGEYMAYCADELAVLLPYFPDLAELTVYGDLPETDKQLLGTLTHVNVQFEPAPSSLPLSDSNYLRHAFNVLPKSNDYQLSSYWRTVAAVFVVALLVQMVYDVARVWRYSHVARQTGELSLQQYKAWFPDDRRVTLANMKKRLESSLNTSKNIDMTALSLISRVGPLLQQANLTASQVQYRDNALELKVTASGLPALQALRTQLSDQGLNAQLGAVNPANGQVSGLVRVQL